MSRALAKTETDGFCPEIDSLRALAMTAVVAMHAGILPFGWTGVWLFFVISGYVVTLSILRDMPAKRPVKALGFFMNRRIGRIVPLYYIYVLVGVAVSIMAGAAFEWPAILSLFAFYHNVAMEFGFGEMAYWPVGHLWTIAVEMQFYAVYGIIAFFAPLHLVKRILIAFVIGAPLAKLVVSIVASDYDPEFAAYLIYSGPGLHFDSFAMGALLAIAQQRADIRTLAWPLMIMGGAALAGYGLVYAGLNAILLDRHGLDIVRDVISGVLFGQLREVFVYSALAAAFTGVVALTAARSPILQPLTSLASLQAVGRVSYGAYILHALGLDLSHWLLLGQIDVPGDRPIGIRIGTFVIAMVFTIVAAFLSYRFLERPAARWLTRSQSRTLAKSFG